MDKEESVEWSNDEAKILRHEALVAEVLKLRSSATAKEKSGSRWSRFVAFLQTNAGVALLTLVFGGLLGTWFTNRVQHQMKEREFQLELQKGRNELALAEWKDYAGHRDETTKQIYDLIGRCVTASEDMIELTGPDFDPKKYPVSEQVEGLLKAYNDCDDQWRIGKEKFGMLIGYYHASSPAVSAAWDEAQLSVTAFMDCSQQWYMKHNLKVVNTEGVCAGEREAVTTKMKGLNKAVNAAHTKLWLVLGLIPDSTPTTNMGQ